MVPTRPRAGRADGTSMEERPVSSFSLSRRSALTAAAVGAVASQASLARAAEPAAARPVADALPALDRLAEDAMARTGVPGMAIAVVHKDAVIYGKGFGLCEAGRLERVDADTVFQLASLSKPIAS